MKIYGKTNIKPLLFEDLKKGQVFYLLDKSQDSLNRHIYMRCGHTTELAAVNLETGICYGFEKNEPVKILDVILQIESEEK